MQNAQQLREEGTEVLSSPRASFETFNFERKENHPLIKTRIDLEAQIRCTGTSNCVTAFASRPNHLGQVNFCWNWNAKTLPIWYLGVLTPSHPGCYPHPLFLCAGQVDPPLSPVPGFKARVNM